MSRAGADAIQLVFDRPALGPDEAAALADRHWGLRGAAVELPSERDRNFSIETGLGDRVVLKIASPAEEDGLLELQHQALRRIEVVDPTLAVPRVRPARSGADLVVDLVDAKPHRLRALSWVAGVPLATARPHSPELLRSIGRTLGRVDRALAGLEHPAARRSLKWDLARATWIEEYFPVIESDSRRALIQRLFQPYQEQVVPRWSSLPAQIIHNDANDYNVLVAGPPDEAERAVGLIDFGDLVWTARVAEVAIAAAYAMLPANDPL